MYQRGEIVYIKELRLYTIKELEYYVSKTSNNMYQRVEVVCIKELK